LMILKFPITQIVLNHSLVTWKTILEFIEDYLRSALITSLDGTFISLTKRRNNGGN